MPARRPGRRAGDSPRAYPPSTSIVHRSPSSSCQPTILREHSSYENGSGAWIDLGGGTSGIAGQPKLIGSGGLFAGTSASTQLTGAPPHALMVEWVSTAPTPFQALGGTVHAFPFSVQRF